jgi:hypothetical protein
MLNVVRKECLHWGHPRAVSFRPQLSYHIAVPALDHFIQIEVIPSNFHVLDVRDKSAKPNIRLLADGRIKAPFSIFQDHLWERCRVAVQLAVGVGQFMFAGEVENVHGLPGIFEVLVVNSPLVGVELAVVVKYKKFRRGFGRGECRLCK